MSGAVGSTSGVIGGEDVEAGEVFVRRRARSAKPTGLAPGLRAKLEYAYHSRQFGSTRGIRLISVVICFRGSFGQQT